MTGWRDVARSVREQEGWHNRDDRHERSQTGANVPIVPNVPANPARSLREWSAALARVDLAAPLPGLPRPRWCQLIDDAKWLLSNFGQQAARDGWSALDLFGVLPGRDGWGGMADRLRASRSLVMGADVARWRRVINGEPESFARGLGGTVPMIALWECE